MHSSTGFWGRFKKLYDHYAPVTAFYDWYFTLLGLRE
jgi:hypothetical protein